MGGFSQILHFDVEVLDDTRKLSVLVARHGRKFWLPRCLSKFTGHGGARRARVWLPRWLAEQKELTPRQVNRAGNF